MTDTRTSRSSLYRLRRISVALDLLVPVQRFRSKNSYQNENTNKVLIVFDAALHNIHPEWMLQTGNEKKTYTKRDIINPVTKMKITYGG